MDYIALSHSALFEGVDPEDIEGMLPCLDARELRLGRGERVYRAGDVVTRLGVVLEGSVNVEANYYWGERAIFAHLGPGQIFAEAYSAIPGGETLVDIVAAEDATVLLLRTSSLLATCERACSRHHRVIGNLLRVSAEKNVALSRRMMHIAPRTIRERVLSYLSEQAVERGSRSFVIPFSRQELANYLGVDRSALSAELSSMQRDGLIVTRRSHFELLAGPGGRRG